MSIIDFNHDVRTSIRAIKDENGQPLGNINDASLNQFPVIYPEDFIGDTMAEKVINANQFILNAGGGFELHFGNSTEYLITEAIILTNNMIVSAKDCDIVLADNTIDNIFRTANITPDPSNPLGFATNKDDAINILYNIKLIGENANLYQCKNATSYGATTVGWRGVLSCICGVNGFEVSGFNVRANLSWSFSFYGVVNGSLHDIDYNTSRENGDGCDFMDAHNIQIYNLSGATQDDTIAIGDHSSTRLDVRPIEKAHPILPFNYDNKAFGGGVGNVYINNINTNGTNHVLILITGKYEVKNIHASNLSDKSEYGVGKNAIIKIYGGQYTGEYTHGLIHDCYLNNITGNACTKATIWLSEGVIKNGHIANVKTTSGKTALLDQSGATISDYNMDITNSTFI